MINVATRDETNSRASAALVKLFCLYTALSIIISIAAWCAVGLDIVEVSPSLLAGISSLDWRLAISIYALGAYLVFSLRTGRPFLVVFASYLGLQASAVILAIGYKGMLYFPAAGSQGTLPAVAISVTMLIYLLSQRQDRTV